jgi:protein-tyrosine phosphatase
VQELFLPFHLIVYCSTERVLDNLDMKKLRVLFVCLGNICRSPLAEAVFKHKLREKNLEKFIEADSCGTANYHVGDRPDARTIVNALKNGVTIDHFGRQLKAEDLEYYDFIFAMDKSNHHNILCLQNAHEHKHKIRLMREFDPVAKGEVPDPYYGTEKDFQEVFDILNRTMDDFLNHLQEKYIPC